MGIGVLIGRNNAAKLSKELADAKAGIVDATKKIESLIAPVKKV